MNAIVETITPAKALEYLRTSLGNRAISKVTVRSYSDTMKAGNWMLNGIPIVFDNEGHLIDGHHRLNAIVDAHIPVMTSVVRGVDPKAFTTFDCGLHRNLGQLLCMQSKKNYNAVGSIVSASESIRLHGKIWSNNKSAKRTNLEAYDIYCKNADAYDKAGEFACKVYRDCKLIRASWVGALYYHLIQIGGYEEPVVNTFLTQLCSYETSSIEPINTLRVRLQKLNKGATSLDPHIMFALIIKTWNFYINGGFKQRISFDPDKEEYPVLKLKDE